MPYSLKDFYIYFCFRDSSWTTLIVTNNLRTDNPKNYFAKIEELTIEEMAQELGN